jgi:L-asparaginase/beta-aspartyl-peptidase (threonine type)
MSEGFAVVVHGGAGASPGDVDGCHAAANAALRVLQANGESLDAVVQAVITLENDGRFNAGSGSALAPDGVTIEMDASVMDTRGRLGAIACVRDVRNPVLLARDVAGTPHRLLAGEGAQRFADVRGLARMGTLSEAVRQRRMQRLKEEMAEMTPEQNAKREAVMRLWNYPGRPLRRADDVCSLDAAFGGGARAQNAACDTVGAVARDAEGHFAVACSTGGVAPALLGRVGDTPLIGAGFYVGKEGAVAVTGTGEDIIPLLLAHTVYQWIADGAVLQQALERGVAQLPPGSDIGIIAVSRTESGHASNRDMPTSTGA